MTKDIERSLFEIFDNCGIVVDGINYLSRKHNWKIHVGSGQLSDMAIENFRKNIDYFTAKINSYNISNLSSEFWSEVIDNLDELKGKEEDVLSQYIYSLFRPFYHLASVVVPNAHKYYNWPKESEFRFQNWRIEHWFDVDGAVEKEEQFIYDAEDFLRQYSRVLSIVLAKYGISIEEEQKKNGIYLTDNPEWYQLKEYYGGKTGDEIFHKTFEKTGKAKEERTCLPKELETDKGIFLFQQAVQDKYMNEEYRWQLTNHSFGAFAMCANYFLGFKTDEKENYRWKPFEFIRKSGRGNDGKNFKNTELSKLYQECNKQETEYMESWFDEIDKKYKKISK